MTAELERESNGRYNLHSAAITANTGISIGVLICVLGLFWKLLDVSNSLTRWQVRVDLRLEALETRIAARPDPWSGTMMKEAFMQLEQLNRQIELTIPDVRAIQKTGMQIQKDSQ